VATVTSPLGHHLRAAHIKRRQEVVATVPAHMPETR
jgi:hypothetical protein